MAGENVKEVLVDLDFSSTTKLVNLPASTAAGQAVEHTQNATLLAAKQDNVTGGNGVAVDGASLALDLVQPATFALVISGMSNSLFNTTYELITTVAYAGNSGYIRDVNLGTDGGDSHYMFWSAANRVVIMKQEGGSWYAYNINSDADSLLFEAAINADLLTGGESFSWDYSYDYDPIVSTSDVYNVLYRVPGESDSNVDYVTGAGSYLEFEAGKVKATVVTDMAQATTGKLSDSSTTKTYVDDAKAHAIVAGNNTFINTTAGLTGSPSTVQAAIESAAAEIDTVQAAATALSSSVVNNSNNINANCSALGIGLGALNMGPFDNASLSDNEDLKTVLEDFADAELLEHTNVVTTLGTNLGDTHLGVLSTITVTDNSTVKSAVEQQGSAITLLQTGAGAFWAAVKYHHHMDTYPLPVGFGDGATDVGSFVIDPDGSNLAIDQLDTGDTILVIDDLGDAEAGIYVVNADDSTSRSLNADSTDEFTTNKTVVVTHGGSHAGATYAYTGSDNPTLGTDPLVFGFKAPSVTGDGTITEAKLDTALAAKVNDKTDKYAETVSLVAGVASVITHGLSTSDVVWSVKDSAGNGLDVEIDATLTTSISVTSQVAKTDVRVVVIG